MRVTPPKLPGTCGSGEQSAILLDGYASSEILPHMDLCLPSPYARCPGAGEADKHPLNCCAPGACPHKGCFLTVRGEEGLGQKTWQRQGGGG